MSEGSNYLDPDRPEAVRLSVGDARALGEAALGRIGYGWDDARIITDQLIDNSLCGYRFAGLPRILAIAREARTRNWRDHAVTFEMGREVFRDPFAIEWEDLEQDPNGERYGVIGMVEGRVLFVGYTMRGEKIRIITARKAEPYERRRYHEENRKA